MDDALAVYHLDLQVQIFRAVAEPQTRDPETCVCGLEADIAFVIRIQLEIARIHG